jgi:hypothetical protein
MSDTFLLDFEGVTSNDAVRFSNTVINPAMAFAISHKATSAKGIAPGLFHARIGHVHTTAGKIAHSFSQSQLDLILLPSCKNSPEHQETLAAMEMADGCESCRLAKATISMSIFKQRPEGKGSTHLYQIIHPDIYGSPH